MKAYPFQHRHPTTGVTTSSEGMDLRDYFAAQAMQGLLSIQEISLAIGKKNITPKDFCASCYEWADSMMKAREPKDEQS